MSLCAVRGLAFLWTDPNFKEDSELSPVERTIKRTLEHIFDDRAEAEGKIAPLPLPCTTTPTGLANRG